MNDYKLDSGKRHYRTLTMLCEDESLSDNQLKAYQTRFQEYRTFLEAVTRLASCGNVCITEESVMVGENGMLNGESLNALQHAGAISVYNALQLNNWEFPVPEEGDIAVTRESPDYSDELLDSENPIRSDWPSIHVSDCFIEGDKAKLHGSVRPLRTFLPPTITFRNAADLEEDVAEQDPVTSNPIPLTDEIEIVNSQKGLFVKRTKKEKSGEVEFMSIDEYFYGKQDPNPDYTEEKAEYKFKCAVCQRMFTSNVKLMHHILEHVDETCPALICFNDNFACQECQISFDSAYEFKLHQSRIHGIGKDQSGYYQRHEDEEPIDESQLALVKSECEFECKICGKECPSKLSLGHHLQFTHRYKEMPYVCRLCLFRSSIYEDILQHFYSHHGNTSHLLCAYCLRIFTPTDARPAGQSPPSQSITGAVTTVGLGTGVGQTQVYLQHLRMHQVKHHVRSCGCCKLNFTNKSDFQMHRRLDHRSALPNNPYPNELKSRSRISTVNQNQNKKTEYSGEEVKPSQEMVHAANDHLMHVDQDPILEYEEQTELVQETNEQIITNPITGVTYKTSNDKILPLDTSHNVKKEISNEDVKEINSRMPTPSKISRLKAATLYANQERIIKAEVNSQKETKSISLNAPEAGRMKDLSSVNCNRFDIKKYPCLECENFLMDGNHRRYLPCSACQFATCCAASFNRHVQSMHVKDSSKLSTSEYQKGMPFLKPIKFPWIQMVGKGSKNTQATDESLEVTEPSNTRNYKIERFRCKRCGFNANDGNSLACHLVEECGSLTVTMNPSEQLVKNYQEICERRATEAKIAEEKYRLNEQNRIQQTVIQEEEEGGVQEFEVENSPATEVVTGTDNGHSEGQQQQDQPNAVAVQTLGVLMPNHAVELTNDQGEVFQTITWPEDLVLEEDQIVVVMQGEDGQVQLAVVSQQSYDPITQQVIISNPEEQEVAPEQESGFPVEEVKENQEHPEIMDYEHIE